MTLLIDIGNTRIKWLDLDEIGIVEQHAANYATWDSEQLHRHLLQRTSPPTEVLIANVGGERIGNLLREGLRSAWGVTPHFVSATASVAGVSNAYSDPQKLGVDRWMGLIAAFHEEKHHVCVANVGTALTIDGVTASGQHLGGVIIPGPDLMISSLLTNTSDIAARANDPYRQSPGLFANNTTAAIQQGATQAVAALIERAYHEMAAKLGSVPILLLAGGASGRILGLLRVPFREVPDLVLRGLAVMARLKP